MGRRISEDNHLPRHPVIAMTGTHRAFSRSRSVAVPTLALAVIFAAAAGQFYAEPSASAQTKAPFEAVIVEPSAVTEKNISTWKSDGFSAIILKLDEKFEAHAYQNAAKQIARQSLPVYYWINVGRNPAIAREHPQWMASLGSHDDWRTRFPDVPQIKEGEVVKAWPWTPIAYREAFAAHLARITGLLQRVPADYRGLLLNDLQGGPSSCGCGNLQCRWAIDYGVPATTAEIKDADVPSRFVAQVGKLAAGKQVIPVWTTECEERDLAPDKQANRGWSTGYCGHVECSQQCPTRFSEQWQALHATHRGPTAILALQKEFGRDRKEYGTAANWIKDTIKYLNQQQPKALPHNQLWVVVQGYDVTPDEERTVRIAALRTEPGAVLVARTRIDQSYEPRIVSAEPK